MAKLENYCLRKAKEDKQWAKKTIKDKKWFQKASDMSKEMLHEKLTKPLKQISKEYCRYLKFRACAKGYVWGQKTWIDNAARTKYKKITGKNPICKNG